MREKAGFQSFEELMAQIKSEYKDEKPVVDE